MRLSHTFQHSAGRRDFGREVIICLLVVLVPNAILLSGNIQLFPAMGWVDPGIYTGYFWDLPGKVQYFGSNYFSMRLPFTLVGYALNCALSPTLAVKFVAVTFNTIAALSIYALVSRRMSQTVGVIMAWAVTLSPLWIATISRTYVDGPAMAYGWAALAAILTVRTDADNRMRYVLGGMLGAASFYTHPIMALPLGASFLADALLRQNNLKTILTDASWIVIGALLTSIVLGVASLLLGGRFLFILSDPWAFTRTFQGFGANYRYSPSEWLPGVFRALPIVIFFAIGTTLLILKRRQGPTFNFAAIGLAAGAITVALLLFLDYGVGGATLQSSFYSSYAIFGTTLIVAAAAYHVFGSTEIHLGKITLAGIAFLGVLFFLFSHVAKIWAWSDKHVGETWIILTFGFITAVVMVMHNTIPKLTLPSAVQHLQSAIQKSGFFLLILMTIFCGIANKDTRRIFIVPTGVNYESTFRTTLAVNDLVKKYLVTGQRLYFWYNRDELTNVDKKFGIFAVYQLRFKDTYFYLNNWDSIAATWLWDRSTLGWTLPTLLPSEQTKLITPVALRGLIVTMCVDISTCEKAPAALKEQNFSSKEITRQRFETEGYTPFWTIIYDAEPNPKM